ncbi:MAG: SUMF1/EgtB/PvdO family nonheme iron enzyme [Deltaproteobacteria bacterium]|nr:SUMF1/EgtB/PvdO family nonheme iron enzyme [Deltaproteobacteria bacterium]
MVVLGLGAVGAGAYVAITASKKADPAVADASPPPKDAAVVDAPAPPRPRVPDGMVLIPAGELAMGSDDAEIDRTFAWCQTLAPDCMRKIYERERPVRTVKLSAFAIDRRERSVGEVRAWIEQLADTTLEGTELVIGGRTVPGSWLVRDKTRLLALARGLMAESPSGKVVFRARDNLPAHGITHDGARAYCRSLGLDLPTEAQWERAARGTAGNRFPWGNDLPTCNRVVFGLGGACPGKPRPAPVDRAEPGDVTPEGVQDLAGNVAEWVRDRFVEQYPPCGTCVDPVVEPTSDASEPRVLRGGMYDALAEQLRGAGRSRRPANEVGDQAGFRCAMRYDPQAP